MKQIRKGVFETNSSSTHSICVASESDISLPTHFHFSIDFFDWEWDTVYDTGSYLYTGLLCQNRQEDINKLKFWLEDSGVEATFEEPKYEGSYLSNGCVDHSHDLTEFLDAVMNDKHHCFEFLFSKGSFVNTGNDNSDGDTSINVNYPHVSYYKGN